MWRASHRGNQPEPAVIRRGSLPSPVSTFIGREAERAHLTEILGDSRLVTLNGSPGVGKTRLALDAATACASVFPGGAWWVDLSSVPEPAGVQAHIARSLGVQDHPDRSLTETLVLWLRDEKALLVLDNCEHLTKAAREAAQALLEGCADLKILATSRQPLGLAGERRVEVGPLPLPHPGAGLAELVATEAVRLFCARAAAVHPVFDPVPSTLAVIGEICRRLDGIPLAIELAAGRVGVLSPEEIAARLDDRFSLLGGTSRSFSSRHRTLPEALDWSYELLSPPEQALLRRLAVFSGDFGFEAVWAVCSGGDVGPGALLDLLAGLVAKSMVVARIAPAPARYRLLETVRAYASERLAATGEAEEVADRHAHWYRRLAEGAERELTGRDQATWLRRLDAEYPNLMTSLDRFVRRQESADALRLSGALIVHWRLRGRFAEGRRWLGAALRHSEDSLIALRAKALWGYGFLSLMSGEQVPAEKALAESLDLYREMGDLVGEARAQLLIGNGQLVALGALAAVDNLRLSVDLARRAGDPWCLAHGLALAGRCLIAQGAIEDGRTMLREALAVAGEAKDIQGMRIAQAALGQLACAQGDLREARAFLESSFEICARLDDPYGVEAASLMLGEVATVSGDYDRAAVLLEQSLLLGMRLGTSLNPTLASLVRLALARGDFDGARRRLDAITDTEGNATVLRLLGLIDLALATDDLDTARDLLGREVIVDAAAVHNLGASRVLHARGRLAEADGEPSLAEARYSDALSLRAQLGDLPGIAQSLESLGSLAAASDSERAARLLGAADSIRRGSGIARNGVDRPTYEAGLAEAQRAISAEQFAEALGQGMRLSAEEAAAYALRGRGPRSARPGNGWDSLTPAEQEVADLVAEGMSNAQIAERRFVNPDTVKKHVRSAFSKLGISSRVDLAKEALRQRR